MDIVMERNGEGKGEGKSQVTSHDRDFYFEFTLAHIVESGFEGGGQGLF